MGMENEKILTITRGEVKSRDKDSKILPHAVERVLKS